MSRPKRFPINVILIGMPGSGKTTVGINLAKRVHKRFVDMDRLLINQFRMPIAQIFSDLGEDAFRDAESALCERLLGFRHSVISTGGGVVLRPSNRIMLRSSGRVVYLSPSIEMLWRRLKNDKQRPLLKTENPRDTLETLYFQRHAMYQDTAHITVEIENQSPFEVAEIIQSRLSH